MPHLVDNKKLMPFSCEQCIHHISGCKCRAFDIIPADLIFDAEKHSAKMEGQKGDYVFETKAERQFDNVYEVR